MAAVTAAAAAAAAAVTLAGEAAGEAAEEAAEEAGLSSVGDLLRYCDDDAGDVEQHVRALALETCGAFSKESLRSVVSEALSLGAATAKLAASATRISAPPSSGDADGDQSALERVWAAANDGPGAKSIGADADPVDVADGNSRGAGGLNDLLDDIDDFEDIIGRHWRHPNGGLGFDGSPVAHMWRSIIWPNNFL